MKTTFVMEVMLPRSAGHFPVLMTGISCIAGFSIFKIVSPTVSTLCFAGYRKLSKTQKARWDCNLVTLSVAMTVGPLSAYGLLFDEEVNGDKVWGTSLLTKLVVSVLSGYMISHLIMFTYLEPAIYFGRIFVFHHILAFLGSAIVGINQTTSYLYYLVCTFELTNIPVTFHYLFKIINVNPSSALVRLNWVIACLSFFLVRVLTLPYYWLMFFHIYAHDTGRPRDGYFAFLFTTASILTIFTGYWFVAMLKEIK